ncbi:hypothetical protein [Janibacter sp. GS2]|uniref:hypothetical protein n=1 Tax=Janibacter sp. GS2 TaxID=3442646 RepID=UPI003EB9E4A3
MDVPSRSALRVARAAAWTCAAFGLSVGAHVIGGGQPPSPGGGALIAMTLLCFGLLLTGRRLGAFSLIATLGTSQLLLHVGLTLTEQSAACTPAPGPSGTHAGHDLALTCDAAVSGAATAITHAGHSALTMTIAHLLAAVALGLVLAKGEDAVWRIAGLLLPHLPRAGALPSLARRVLAPTHGGEAVTEVPLLGGVGRRGPPARPAPVVT